MILRVFDQPKSTVCSSIFCLHTLATSALCMILNEIRTTFNPTPWHPRVHYLLYVCVVWISVIPYKKYNAQGGSYKYSCIDQCTSSVLFGILLVVVLPYKSCCFVLLWYYRLLGFDVIISSANPFYCPLLLLMDLKVIWSLKQVDKCSFIFFFPPNAALFLCRDSGCKNTLIRPFFTQTHPVLCYSSYHL